MDRCADAREAVVELLFDGLDDDERSRLEAHVAGCSSCRIELDEMTALAGALTSNAEVVTGAAAAPSVRSIAAPTPGAGPVRRTRRVAVLAGLVLIGVLGTVVARTASHRSSGDRLQVAVDGGAADGTVILHELDTGVGVHLQLTGLDPLGDGTYETWMLGTDGSTTSVGSFVPAADGRASLQLHGTGDLPHYRGLVITAEPDRLDPARNGPAVATASFPIDDHEPTPTPEEGTS